MKKKIVYALVTNDLNYDQRMQRICTSLQRNGYVVTLVGRVLPDSLPLSAQPFNQKRLRCFFNKGVVFYIEMNIRLILFLLSQKIDIIHAADLDTIGAARIVKLFKNTKIVFDAHEYFTEVPELEGKKVKKRIWTWLGKLCVPKSDAAVTVSAPLQPILKEKYGIEFQLLRNFPLKIQEAPEVAYIEKRENIILYQGAVNSGRGIKEMMQAMLLLEDWEFWVAGKGDLYEECKALKEELGLSKRVRFLGYIRPEELKEITVKARIGVNFLEGISKNYLYSSANKFFDYIQALLPGLTMSFPVYEGVVKEFQVGELVAEIVPHEIVAAVKKIDKNYMSYVSACRKARELYTWDKEEKRLISIYESL